jgi:LPS sulfotransferase NodH
VTDARQTKIWRAVDSDPDAMLADRGYDSDAIRHDLKDHERRA